MTTIFSQLGYNYTPSHNEIVTFANTVTDNLNTVPQLLDKWQYDDLKNNDTAITNYVENPVSSIASTLRSTCISIASACSDVNTLITIVSAAGSACTACDNFVAHTNRLAGLVEPNASTYNLPHYDMAIGTGKVLVNIIYQADGIQNNAPIMGNFTSLFIEDTLTTEYNTISGYPTLISNSISVNTWDDGLGNTFTENVSSLTTEQINTIVSNVGTITSTMNTRRTHDENFYTNSRSVLDKYQRLRKFKKDGIGTSEVNMINDYIGTTRLKNNIANTA